MAVIARQLGHSDTRMTEKHYAHLAPNYVADTIRGNFPRLTEPSAPKVVHWSGFHQPRVLIFFLVEVGKYCTADCAKRAHATFLQPSSYERPTLSGKFNKNRDFWQRPATFVRDWVRRFIGYLLVESQSALAATLPQSMSAMPLKATDCCAAAK